MTQCTISWSYDTYHLQIINNLWRKDNFHNTHIDYRISFRIIKL